MLEIKSSFDGPCGLVDLPKQLTKKSLTEAVRQESFDKTRSRSMNEGRECSSQTTTMSGKYLISRKPQTSNLVVSVQSNGAS